MFKKGMAIIPVILSASLLVSPMPTLAGVAGSDSITVTLPVTVPAYGSSGGSFTSGGAGGDQQSQPAISLDEAASTVKQAFTIPAQATNFSSNLFKSMNRQVWDLRWMDPQNQPSGLDVQVDAATGEIISMRIDQFRFPGMG